MGFQLPISWLAGFQPSTVGFIYGIILPTHLPNTNQVNVGKCCHTLILCENVFAPANEMIMDPVMMVQQGMTGRQGLDLLGF